MNLKNLYRNWVAHNFIGHPMMQTFNMLNMNSAAKFIHDITLPEVVEKPVHVAFNKEKNLDKEKAN